MDKAAGDDHPKGAQQQDVTWKNQAENVESVSDPQYIKVLFQTSLCIAMMVCTKMPCIVCTKLPCT